MESNEFAKLLAIPELPTYLKRVDYLLKSLITTKNKTIKTPALRVVSTPGKRLRPILLIAAAWNKQKHINDNTIACCAAVELAHISTLVHDDIIDNASTRRGIQTINSKEGISNAIVVGDYLLMIALAQASTVSKEIAHLLASSIAVTCDGQSQEMADCFNLDRTLPNYRETIRKKTAILIAAACQIGGLCAGSSVKEIEAFGKYGEAFGMSFQITDDLLDFLSTPEKLGKPVGNDIKEGVYTMPLIVTLGGPYGKDVRSCLNKNRKLSEIIDILKRSGAIDKTLNEARNYNKAAVKVITKIDKTNLSKVPDFYLDLALKKCYSYPVVPLNKKQ